MSEIKQEPYTPGDVRALLQSFEGSAGQALLFLKNVRSISMHIKRAGGSPVELFKRISLNTQVRLELSGSPGCHDLFALSSQWMQVLE